MQPPAKKRHGWEPEQTAVEGGTATPLLPSSALGALAESDFPVLDGQLDLPIPTPTAGVIKSLKAGTRQAVLNMVKGKKGGKGKAKTKGGKGKTFHIDQADELLDALLRRTDAMGTPAEGGETGHLGGGSADGSTTSGMQQPSDGSGGESQQPVAVTGRTGVAQTEGSSSSGAAAHSGGPLTSSASVLPSASGAGGAHAPAGAIGSGAGTGDSNHPPTPSPANPPLGAQEEGSVSPGDQTPSAAGQPPGQASCNQ